MSLVKISLPLLFSTCLVAGCGLRGPLYLPDDEQSTKPASEQEAKEAQKKKQEDEEEGDGSNLRN